MEKIKEVENLAADLLKHLGFEMRPSVTFTDNAYHVSILADTDSALLIGYHGETLNSLQVVISAFLFRKFGESLPLVVDVNGYRADRSLRLKSLAVRTSDKARFLGLPQTLPPMGAFERRLIHLFVSEIQGVKSESIGEGRGRQVVISPRSGPAEPDRGDSVVGVEELGKKDEV